MITASLGSHRFEAGPTYHYNASNTPELIDTMFNPEATTDYVNALKDVKATPEEIQQVAAAGIVRMAIANAEYEYIPEATQMLLKVCSGNTNQVSPDIFKNPYSWSEQVYDRYKLHSSLANATFDSASVFATRRNRAKETAQFIEEESGTDEGLFVIGLANGGIISAAHTFLQLGEGDHELSFVKYSRHKDGDEIPCMYPYPSERQDWLKRSAEDRQVVIYDEDYSSGRTLKTAVDFFGKLFGQSIIGIAPVEVERRITYKPLVIKAD